MPDPKTRAFDLRSEMMREESEREKNSHCPLCDDKGYTSAPYIWPVAFVCNACTCVAGGRFRAEIAAIATPIPEDE